MTRKILLFTFGLIIGGIQLSAQSIHAIIHPEVGKPMPGMVIRNIRYYSKNKANVEDFKGKWLLLDFWSKTCGACIASFPHTNQIQKNLGDSIQVMLVGIQDEEGQIEPLYAKYRDRQHLVMPSAFDSALANGLEISSVPRSILIDPKGIVRGIASSFNAAEIEDFLKGKAPVLSKSEEHYDFDNGKPLLMNGNGGKDADFLFRSVLSTWDRSKHRQYVPSSIAPGNGSGSFQVLGAPLEWLYNYAYFGQSDWNAYDTVHYGKDYVHPILEIQDSSKFAYNYKYSRNIYSYSLIMPPGLCTEESMKRAMQRDLETYFGFTAQVETIDCPAWKLVASKEAREKLRTKVKTPYYRQLVYGASFIAGNFPFGALVNWIKSNQGDKVILDESGISGNIDISMDCIPTDFNDLQNALHANGLDLVPSSTPMKVVVIRENKQSVSMK